jgi:hypothetical protein
MLALGLLAAGLAAGLGPAGAVMGRGDDKPSVTELNRDCDGDGLCHCDGRGGVETADCRALQDANPDCEEWRDLGGGIWWCQIPEGEPIFHPDGTKSVTPEDDPTLSIDPGLILSPVGLRARPLTARIETDEPVVADDPDGAGDELDGE